MELLSTQLGTLIRRFSRVLNDGTPDQESVEALIISAERVHRLIAILVDVIPEMERNLELIEFVISSLGSIAVVLGNDGCYNAFSAPRFISGERGRPRVVISQDMIEYFIFNKFSVHQTAQLLQTSISTVRHRMRQFGISVRSTYSVIDDTQLDILVTRLQHTYPNCGYRLMRGHLAPWGIEYRRETRIRDSLRRVDPLGIMNRWIQGIQRRTYSVPGPNFLWHIDGNHKLIRYICYCNVH